MGADADENESQSCESMLCSIFYPGQQISEACTDCFRIAQQALGALMCLLLPLPLNYFRGKAGFRNTTP